VSTIQIQSTLIRTQLKTANDQRWSTSEITTKSPKPTGHWCLPPNQQATDACPQSNRPPMPAFNRTGHRCLPSNQQASDACLQTNKLPMPAFDKATNQQIAAYIIGHHSPKGGWRAVVKRRDACLANRPRDIELYWSDHVDRPQTANPRSKGVI